MEVTKISIVKKNFLFFDQSSKKFGYHNILTLKTEGEVAAEKKKELDGTKGDEFI